MDAWGGSFGQSWGSSFGGEYSSDCWGTSWGGSWGQSWGSAGVRPAAKKVGGYDHKTTHRRWRYVREIDGRLVFFDSEAEAIAYQPEPVKVDAPKQKPAKPEVQRVSLAYDVRSIDIQSAAALAAQYEQAQRFRALVDAQRLALAVELYESLLRKQDEDDVELLLLFA